MRVLAVGSNFALCEILTKVCREISAEMVVTAVTDGASAIRYFSIEGADLMLLDLHLHDVDSYAVARVAKKAAPNVRIVALSSLCSPYLICCVARHEINGFIDTSRANMNYFSIAIARIVARGAYFSSSFQEFRARRALSSERFEKILSDREQEILALIAVPYNDSEIAMELDISSQTVEKHRFNMLRKLGLCTTFELIRFARINGIYPSARNQGAREELERGGGERTTPVPPRGAPASGRIQFQ